MQVLAAEFSVYVENSAAFWRKSLKDNLFLFLFFKQALKETRSVFLELSNPR
jgi:hypothetical protein